MKNKNYIKDIVYNKYKRTLRIMKISTFLIFISAFNLLAERSYSQGKDISLKLAKTYTIENVISEIEKTTDYFFIYNEDVVPTLKKETKVDMNDQSIDEILSQLIKSTDLAYCLSSKQITLYKDKNKNAQTQITYVAPLLIQQQTGKTVTGTIVDENEEAIIGANIIEKGTTNGTITDIDGNFSLKVNDNAILEVKYIGYVEQEIAVKDKNTINVVLKEDTKTLDELVVVGMNLRQTKRSVTGAMSTIQTKELKQSPVANLNNALAGRIPGLITVQTTGEPGRDAADMYIRGISTYGSNTAPLIVIDGLPRDQSSFSQIDPNEVESISILKDASSSALYGIQGANGVVVVTTKRGVRQQKPRINLTVQSGALQITRLPEPVGVLEYATKYEIPMAINDGKETIYTDKVLERLADGTADPYLYPDVNWMKEILKKNTMQQQYNINISGSSNIVNYFVSGSFLNQGAALKHQKEFNDNYGKRNGFDRYNFRSNIDIQASSRLKVQVDLATRTEKRTGPASSFNEVFDILRWIGSSSNPIKLPNGSLGYGSATTLPYWKNLYGLVTQSGYYENTTNATYGTISAIHELDFILPGLSMQGFFSFENSGLSHTTRLQSFDSFHYQGLNVDGEPQYQQYGIKSSLSTGGYNTVNNKTYLDIRLLYQQEWKDHKTTAQLLGNRTLRTVNQELPYAYQGFSSRFSYGFKDRYFAEVNMSFNGSENFPKGNRYGFFPSGSLAWIASDEDFMLGVKWIDYLKIRTSIGMTGNDQIGGNRWLYQTDYERQGGYSFGVSPSGKPGFSETRIGNPVVTWERSRKMNVGFELAILEKRMISLSLDYFKERRTNILTPPGTVPDYLGISNLSPLNSGVVENKGFDGELSFSKYWPDWGFFSRLQATYAENKVIENDQPTPAFDYQDLRGYPVGYQLGYKSIGFFKDEEDIKNSPIQNFDNKNIPGDIKYVDINNDGVIDPNDRIPLRRQIVPKLVGGFSFGVSYKGLDISALLNGAVGGKAIFKPSTQDRRTIAQLWTEDNHDNAKQPVPKEGLNNSMVATDFWLVDTDYLKLRNVEIGYVLPGFVKGVKEARFFVNAHNLAIWDKLWVKDRDPEVTADAFRYPIQRVFNIGINIQF